jgi:hypothetical protein
MGISKPDAAFSIVENFLIGDIQRQEFMQSLHHDSVQVTKEGSLGRPSGGMIQSD